MRNNGHIRRKPTEPATAWSDALRLPDAPPPAAAVQPPALRSEGAPQHGEPAPAGHGHQFGGFSLFAEPQPAAPEAPPPPEAHSPAARQIAGWLGAQPAQAHRLTLQASLRLGPPDDAYEREADQIAGRVMRSPDSAGEAGETGIAPTPLPYTIQRSTDDAGLPVAPAVASAVGGMRGGGQPLPAGERDFFERRFGHDFGQIRIHAGDEAAATARSLDARAFTVGNDIAFDAGEYQPGTVGGRQLLAHELTHTIQQTGGVAAKRAQRKAPARTPAAPVAGEQDEPERRPEDTEESDTGGAPSGATRSVPASRAATPEGEAAARPARRRPRTAALAPQATEQPSAGAEATQASAADAAVEQASAEGEAGQQEAEAGQRATGRVIQRAPRSPDADPDFQAVAAGVGRAAATQKEHDPAQQKADEAAAAAVMPPEERLGAADHIQTDAIAEAVAQQQGGKGGAAPRRRKSPLKRAIASVFEALGAQEPAEDAGGQQAGPADQVPGFDKAAFKAAIAARINALTPQNPEQMEDIGGSGVFQEVKTTVDQSVESGKEQASGQIDERVAETPDQGAVLPKPVTPLVPNDPGPQPGAPDASGAAPKTRGADEVEDPLLAESRQLDTLMEQEQVTAEQINDSNEPEFQGALQAKVEAQAHLQAALPVFRAQEQGQLQAAQAEAGAQTEAGLGGMFTERSGAFGQMDTLQGDTKGQDEDARARIGTSIDAIFQSARADVQAILAALDQEVDQVFSAGADAAKQAAVEYIHRETKAYKDRRYHRRGGWLKRAWGAVVSGWDNLTGMPDEYFEYYRRGRDLYLAEMDTVLDRVAAVVAGHLTKAHQRIQQGRSEIERLVASQPPELQEIARQAALEAEGRFGELERSIDSKQQALVERLSQQYVERLQALDSELEQMQQAERGLLAKVGDLIRNVIATIVEIRDKLLNILKRALDVIIAIIRNPIRFLGNLLRAIGQGLRQFVGNIGKHLVTGLIEWLTGTLTEAGIQLPDTWDFKGILSLVMQILGISYGQIRAKVVAALGDGSEQVIGLIEQGWEIFKTIRSEGLGGLSKVLGESTEYIQSELGGALGAAGGQVLQIIQEAVEIFQIIQSEGLAGLWRFIKDKIGDLKALVLDAIKDLVMDTVIRAGIEWLLGMMGGPAGAFIKAVQAIIRVVSWFIENAAQLAKVVGSILDSIEPVVAGDIDGAADRIEEALGDAVPLLIGFLAKILGLGGIADKIRGVIEKVREVVDEGIGWLVGGVVKVAKKLWDMLKGKKKNKEEEDKDTEADQDDAMENIPLPDIQGEPQERDDQANAAQIQGISPGLSFPDSSSQLKVEADLVLESSTSQNQSSEFSYKQDSLHYKPDSLQSKFLFGSRVQQGSLPLPTGYFGREVPTYNINLLSWSKREDIIIIRGRIFVDCTWTVVDSPSHIDISSAYDPDVTRDTWARIFLDLTPDQTGRPARTKYWARDITERHEKFHASDDIHRARMYMPVVADWLNSQVITKNEEEIECLTREERLNARSAQKSYYTSQIQLLLLEASSKIEVDGLNYYNNNDAGEDRAYADGKELYQERAQSIDKRATKEGW